MAAKTSEGKTSAWVLGLMPIVFTLIVHHFNPDWLEPLWRDPLGNVLVGLAALFTLGGVAAVLRISRLDA